MVLRTKATTSSTVSEPTTSTTAHNSNTMSLEEYLASPSPRCCACDKRGGYHQAKSIPPFGLPETRPSVAVPASSETIGNIPDRGTNDAGRGTTNDRRSNACARKNQFHDDGEGARRGSMDVREEQLVVHLQDCLKHMTHLRDWLRLLDQELG